MNKARLAEAMAEKLNIHKKEAEKFIEAFQDIVTNTIKGGEEVTIAGFGTFMSKVRESRMGVNPQKPSERIKIPTVTVPKFKAGKALKDALKSKQ